MDREAVAGALVVLQDGSSNAKQETHSDSHGAYRFKALATGSYTLHAEVPSKGTESVQLSLSEGETKTIDLSLRPAASNKPPAFYDEPSFTVAGVSESSGAGVHASQATARNADALAKDTASLGTSSANPSASSLSREARNGQGIEQLRSAIASNDEAQLHSELGHLEEGEGHSLEALDEFQRAAEMDPSESNYFDWGTELLVHRAAAPAAEVFVKGNQLHPESVRMLIGLAVAEYAQGSYNAAVDHLCQATDLDPQNRVPYTFLGRMQNPEVRRSAKVLPALARYAEIYPNDVHANYYYAVAMWDQRSAANAPAIAAQVQTLLQKSLAIDPKFAAAYLQLGILESARQQFREAAADFEKAIVLDSSLHEAHYRLALAYRRLGENEKAQRQTEIYQRETTAENEDDKREQKNIQQFIYELKSPPPSTLH